MTTTSPGRVYGGLTSEQRTAARRSALLEAAIAVVGDAGWRGLTAEGVSQRARLSKTYFYENFADVDALADAVIEHLGARFAETIVGAFEPSLSGLDRAIPVARALVAWVVELPDRARVLFGGSGGGDAWDAFRHKALHSITQVVHDRAIETYGRPLADDPVVDLGSSFLVGGTGRAILDWIDGLASMSEQQFVEDLAAFWVTIGKVAIDQASARSKAEPQR